MDGFVVAAVLFGALLHAGWNTLVKGAGDQQADLAHGSPHHEVCHPAAMSGRRPRAHALTGIKPARV